LITIGIDPHKDTHTAAAVKDATGELLGELTVAGTEGATSASSPGPTGWPPRVACASRSRTAATSTAASSAFSSPPPNRWCGSAPG